MADQPFGRLDGIGPPEGAGQVIGHGVLHAGVDVAQPLDPADSEHRRRRFQLDGAVLAKGLALGEDAVGDLAVFTACRHDQHDSVALGRQLGHGPAGQDALVIGMGVKEHGGGHGMHPGTVPPKRPAPALAHDAGLPERRRGCRTCRPRAASSTASTGACAWPSRRCTASKSLAEAAARLGDTIGAALRA